MRPIDETQQETSDTSAQQPTSSKKPTGMAPRWAAIIGMLAVGVLYAALPPSLRVGPSWLLLAIEAGFLLPLLIPRLAKRRLSHRTTRTLLLLCIITLALAVGVALLIITLPIDKNAVTLLREAVVLLVY